MPQTVCPYGAERRPWLTEWVQLGESLIDSILGPINAVLLPFGVPLIGRVYNRDSVCSQPHPGYPTFTASDWQDPLGLAAKVSQYFDAWVWDTSCQCAAPVGG